MRDRQTKAILFHDHRLPPGTAPLRLRYPVRTPPSRSRSFGPYAIFNIYEQSFRFNNAFREAPHRVIARRDAENIVFLVEK